MLRWLLLAPMLLAVVLTAGCGDGAGDQGPAADAALPVVTLLVGDTPVRAEVARTPEQMERGLGFRDSLPDDAGMLFVFNFPSRFQFWMRGMRFALDFIWIDGDGTVREVTADVPPEPGVPDQELRRYQPAYDVTYVLEVNAGFAARHGIAPGDHVDLSPVNALPPP